MSKLLGDHYEAKALTLLTQQGLKLVEKNFRGAGGEIDLIMRDRNEWVFVEVRYRHSSSFYNALESIGWQKQQRLIRAAECFLQSQTSTHSCRFDVLVFSQHHHQWLRNAFEITS